MEQNKGLVLNSERRMILHNLIMEIKSLNNMAVIETKHKTGAITTQEAMKCVVHAGVLQSSADMLELVAWCCD